MERANTLKLYPYQREDIEHLKLMPRAINANFMGAGKTVETLVLLDELKTRHNLIISKKTMVPRWFQMCYEWLDGDMLTPHDSNTYDHRLAGLDLKTPRFVCVNYDLLSIPRYVQILRSVSWDAIVFDEAHHIKNYKAARTKTAFLLTQQAKRVLFLTGTPIRNTPMDLYSLFHIINPKVFNSALAWRDWFCVTETEEIWLRNPYTGKPEPRLIKRILPGVKNADTLNKLLHKYMIRRERSEVLGDLPPKQYKVIPVELGPEAKQYRQMEEEYLAILDSGEEVYAPKAIAQMLRLRQICLDPYTLLPEGPRPSTPSNKTLALLDIIEGTDSKIVVFSCFERYISILDSVLTERNIPHVVVTGKVSTFERARAETEFQTNPNIQVLLATIGAAGEGPTYSSADIVVFTDLFWSPAVNEQAEDRVYGRVDKGLGLDKTVLIIDLYCKGTIEDHVHRIVRAKERLIEKVVMQRVADEIRKARRA